MKLRWRELNMLKVHSFLRYTTDCLLQCCYFSDKFMWAVCMQRLAIIFYNWPRKIDMLVFINYSLVLFCILNDFCIENCWFSTNCSVHAEARIPIIILHFYIIWYKSTDKLDLLHFSCWWTWNTARITQKRRRIICDEVMW